MHSHDSFRSISKIMVFDFLQFAIFYRLFRCHIEAPSGLGRFRPMAAEQTKRRQRGGSHCNALQIYIEPGFSLFLQNYLDTDFFAICKILQVI